MRSAQQHDKAARMGGMSVDGAGATLAGRRDAQAFANRSPQEVQQARMTAASALSPLAGEAGNFQAMSQASAAQKSQKDAAWNEKMDGYEAKRDVDANNNGIPDRDEAVATKYGNSGINNISDLASVNAKYNVYMRGYKSNPEAMSSSRPMSFDEFAKANHAEYGKRPVYGAEQSAGNAGAQGGGGQASSPLLGAIQAGRDAASRSRAAEADSPARQMRQQMAQERFAQINAMGQARNMGYSQEQAAAMAQNQTALNQQRANEQTVRNDAIGLEELRQNAETGRTQLTTDAQRHGFDTQGKVGLAGVDAQRQVSSDALKGTMHTADQALAGQQAQFAAQQGIAQGMNETQRYITDANATSQENLAGIQSQSAEKINQIMADTQLSVAEKEAEVRREQIQAQQATSALQAEVQREIGVGQNEVGMAGVEAGERSATGQQATQMGIAELENKTRQQGIQSQAEAARDGFASQERIAGLQGQNQLAISQQEIQGKIEQIREAANDPARRIEMAMQIQQMNPSVVAKQAGLDEAARVRAATNGTATSQQLQVAADRASKAAFATAVPMWQALQSDPTISSMFGGGSPLSPSGTFTGQNQPPGQQPVPQSPLTAPKFDMTGGTGEPLVPGPGYSGKARTAIPPNELSRVIDQLTAFNDGRPPTREEVDAQIASDPNLGQYILPDYWKPGMPVSGHNPWLGGFSINP